MARFGIYYLRSSSFSLSNIRVQGRRVQLGFPPEERQTLEYELGKILFEDCYQLAALEQKLNGQVKTVLDVGANVGLFGIAARHYFPRAKVHMYEPNSSLKSFLENHCEAIGAEYFIEAVGKNNGTVNLELKNGSMHSVTRRDEAGSIRQIAFGEAIERLGGKVDLVKLDCEGAEWSIFERVRDWENVSHLTMEYHLWAEPGYEVNDVFDALDRIGFYCWSHIPSPSGQWGMLQASKKIA